MNKNNLPRLTDYDWFKGVYLNIYRILQKNGRLPSPDEIRVTSKPFNRVLREYIVPRSTVLGVAFKNEKTIWFRYMPPDLVTFAHELIHLCEKRLDDEYEEIYGYNLSHLIVHFALWDIETKKNPLTLFEDVTLSRLMEAIRKIYKHDFKDVCEFFESRGIITTFMIPVATENGIAFKIDEDFDEKAIVILSLTEIIAGIKYDRRSLELILYLLNN